jgi:hypothetical protein
MIEKFFLQMNEELVLVVHDSLPLDRQEILEEEDDDH